MKNRKWLAILLTGALLLSQFAYGEETKNHEIVMSDSPDTTQVVALPENPEDMENKETASKMTADMPEDSMIFVFETTGKEEGSGKESGAVDEMLEAAAKLKNEAREIIENPDAANNETLELSLNPYDPQDESEEDGELGAADSENEHELMGMPLEDSTERGQGEEAPADPEGQEAEMIPAEEKAAEENGTDGVFQPEATGITEGMEEDTEAADEEPAGKTEPETTETDETRDANQKLQTEPERSSQQETAAETEELELSSQDELEASTEEVVQGTKTEFLGKTQTEADRLEPEAGLNAENPALLGNAEGNPATDDPERADTAAEISKLAVMPVKANQKYSQLTFSFTAEGREYSCLVTGLAETETSQETAWQRLAEDIAESFLAGKIFTLSETGAAAKYDLVLDLIDAEKISKWGDDANICWAASTADMLEYTGWNKAEDEDAAFQEFREEFNNRGGYQSIGVGWYLNGVNPYQASYSRSGNVAYGQDLNGAAQQQNEGTGGYWKDYAAASVSETHDEQLEERLEDAADRLEEGYGIGVGSYFYSSPETIKAGHALTVFGYIREKLEEAAAAIRALFISDSDDRANGTQTNPAAYPDEYVMYLTAPFENSSMSSVQLQNYNASYATVIGNITTLAPLNSSDPERAGTKDAVQNPNLIPMGVRVENEDGAEITETAPGTAITLGTEFKNLSYKSLPEQAEIRYAVKVYRDGELENELEKGVSIGGKGLHPNKSVEDSLQVRLEKKGEYTFETKVIEVITADGKSIPEAYISDNLYHGVTRLTVTDEAEEDPRAEEKNALPEENPQKEKPERPETSESAPKGNTGAARKSKEAGEPIYTLTVDLTTDTEFVLGFDASVSSPERFSLLRNRKTGKTVDPENYRIIRGEENDYSIVFAESFIRTLKPGRNDFTLTWNGGRVLIRIIIM